MSGTLIVGGGPVATKLLRSELESAPELVIAVDYGGFYLHELGVIPHILMGDLDSLSGLVVDKLTGAGVRVIRYSPQKDETDMELALDFAIAGGAKRINILGGLGRRLDHSLANIGLLFEAAARNVEVHLLDESHDLTAVRRRIVLERRKGWAVSLIPLTVKVSGVTTSGLLYPLDNADLFIEKSRGIHNEFCTDTAVIELAEGLLLVILFKEEQ